MLTAVLSIIFHVSNIFVLPGIPFALYSATYKIGFPGWPEPILDSVTGFGASITKRGLAPAPFFISTGLPPTPSLGRSNITTADSQEGHRTQPFLLRGQPRSPKQIRRTAERYRPRLSPFSLRTYNYGLCTKKMSGRWGERPLGRGDGGYCNPKSAWFFWPFCCAREQQDDTQEHTSHYRWVAPESQTAPDYLPSLPPAEFSVDSSMGSFFPVLAVPADAPLFGTEVLPG